MESIRTHVVLPKDVVEGIDELVGQRGRSAFLADIARREINRRKLMEILSDPEPIWKFEDHPELQGGSAAWVSNMRREEQATRDRRNQAYFSEKIPAPKTATRKVAPKVR